MKPQTDINFVEHKIAGYKPRTEANILDSDGTIAIAIDFNTAGEKCTHSLAVKHNRPILQIDVLDLLHETKVLCGVISTFILENNLTKLNIAGNGLYTFKGWTQTHLDVLMRQVFIELTYNHLPESYLRVQSGGQTGMDEAGVKAARDVGLTTKIIAPKGWMFRLGTGEDIKDEAKFKARFQ